MKNWAANVSQNGGWAESMKNSGKRIFAVLIAVVVASIPLMASAGLFWSQR